MDIFQSMFKEIKKTIEENSIYKEIPSDKSTWSPEEVKRVETMLALPDIRPYDEDGSLEAWYYRISLWGKIKIIQNNPVEGIRNKIMSKEEFLSHVDDKSKNDIFGKWDIDVLAVNKMRYYRTNWGLDGKDKEEEMVFEIDLREDLKKLLKKK